MKCKLSICTLILFVLAFRGMDLSATQQQISQSVELLETGAFHGDEITARTSEKWLGLYIEDGHSTLLNYRVTVEAVFDEILQETDEKTGKRVSVDLPLQPVFLVKAKFLSGGPVTTLFGQDSKALEVASPLTFELAETSYVLKVVGSEDTAKCSEQTLPKNARLVLTSGQSGQVLYSLQGCGDDASWSLLWAGDLDRDGKLDLYVNVTQHYNISERKLFLSSQAGESELVRQVAELVTSGC
jgi:hypothetical protein